MNILMIEDNQSVSEMMQMFFLNEGWEATFKYDGKEEPMPFRKPTTLGYDYTRPEFAHTGRYASRKRDPQSFKYCADYHADS